MDLFAFDDLYVRRLKEHDRETEDHFFKYLSSLLVAKLWRRLSDFHDIEDIIQETFKRALTRLDDLSDSRKLGAFVLGISNHVLQEWYRKESRTEPLNEGHETIPGPSNLEAELLGKETTTQVRRTLGEMTAREADILRAMFLDHEDKDEICRRFGVDRKYLRVLLYRAKRNFRTEYQRMSGSGF